MAEIGREVSVSGRSGSTSRKRGETWGTPGTSSSHGGSSRRAAIVAAFEAIHIYERGLMLRLIAGLKEIPGLRIYGISDPERFDERCPTLAVRVEGYSPLELASGLGERGFFTWDGNYYALNLTERLDVEKSGGFLRIGLVHYNTAEEVDRLVGALREIVGR
jgi:selenocysteine lyase/cysteine desulfurase